MQFAHLTDEILICRFRNSGEADYFAVLFRRHQRRVYALAYRFHRDYGRAEDCVQETFLRAFEEIHRYDDSISGGCFRAWLLTIARHVCVDEFRRERLQACVEERESVGRKPNQEQSMMIAEAMDRLRAMPRENHISYLLWIKGYTYKEIMDLEGLTYGEVKTHIQTAKRQLNRTFRA